MEHDTPHRCDPDEGFDHVLAALGLDIARVDLALLPPARCRHRLLELAPTPPGPDSLGRCRTCHLDVVRRGGRLVHDVPVEPADTRPDRWLQAARHKPRPETSVPCPSP